MATRDALDWCDQNMHTSYPIVGSATAKSTTGVYLPQSLVVDFQLVIPRLDDADATSRFYIESVFTQSSNCYIQIGYKSAKEGAFTCAVTDPFSLELRNTADLEERTINLSPNLSSIPDTYKGLKTLTGYIIIGSCIDVDALLPLNFEYSATALLNLRVYQQLDGINSITVIDKDGNSTVCTNDITLEAGDGLDFETVESTDEDGQPCFTITIKQADTEELTTLEDVFNTVEAYKGTAIRRINGIGPDSEGNFSITTGDCLTLETAGNGLTLSNPCSKPCCDETSISDVQSALQSIEQAQTRLETEYQNIATNINSMQYRLALLINKGTD